MPSRALESELEARVRKYCQTRRCLYWKFTSPGTKGVPDRIIVSPQGTVGFLELKRKGETPYALQRYWIHELEGRNCPVMFVDNYEDAMLFIDNLCGVLVVKSPFTGQIQKYQHLL